MSISSIEDTRALARGLREPSAYDHPVENVHIIETHISYVVLTGAFAYKIKKPVTLPFLDFTSLEKRKAGCHEEIRLNSRLAPRLYLGVVAITGDLRKPVVNGAGQTIEYAVKMRQFPESARLDLVLDRGELSPSLVTDIADQVARFHQAAPTPAGGEDYQGSAQRFKDISQNFDALALLPETASRSKTLSKLRDWSMDSLVVHGELLSKRRRDGFVRECHGDMHLANMTLFDDGIVIFDALEFNPSLRFIDVMSEVAFLVMDLSHRDRPDLASLFLTLYLEHTGDYDGLKLLRHFVVYRALVRAKVAAIRFQQPELTEEDRQTALSQVDGYLTTALEWIGQMPKPFMLIVCGPSGSGKSYISERICGRLGAIRVRSDTERRRRAVAGENRYSAFARHRTYMRVEACADKVLQAGYPLIVDATCIRAEYRQRFWKLANDLQVPFGIVWLSAPKEVLQRRVALRHSAGSDASEATVKVLERQLEEIEPLSPAELEFALEFESTDDADIAAIERFVGRMQRLPLEHRFHRQFRA